MPPGVTKDVRTHCWIDLVVATARFVATYALPPPPPHLPNLSITAVSPLRKRAPLLLERVFRHEGQVG
jgi:hypothetical protein